jgi:hypothetical protein
MKIISQSNIWGEYGYDRFCQSIIDAGIEHQFVDVIPFTESFRTEVDFIPDYIFGSGRFVNICRVKNFPTFPSFGPIELDIFPKELWINGDGYECLWKDLKIDSDKFIKPFTEKFFTGILVNSQSDIEKIQLATSFIEDEGEERVWVSSPKNIKQEIRFFILHGNLITGSVYKNNGIGHHISIDYNHPSWNVCQDFMKDVPKEYKNSFALDLGLVDGEWKIVEMNNLNSSGLYKCDTDALVRALISLHV